MNLTDDQVRELCARRDIGVLAAAATSHPAAAALVKDVPPEQLRMLVDDGIQARNTLVEANIGLAAHVVNRAVRGERHRQDYLQESMLALINAADRYDPTRGASLATYAYPHIKGAVLNLINTRGGDLHISDGQARAKELVRAATSQLAAAGPPARPAEVAEHLGKTEEWVRRYASYQRPTPLSAVTLRQLQIADTTAQQEVETVRETPLSRYLPMLPEAERTALDLVHGLTGERHTFEEVSAAMGISTSKVKRYVASGHADLRRLSKHFDHQADEARILTRKRPTPTQRDLRVQPRAAKSKTR